METSFHKVNLIPVFAKSHKRKDKEHKADKITNYPQFLKKALAVDKQVISAQGISANKKIICYAEQFRKILPHRIYYGCNHKIQEKMILGLFF